MQDKEIYTLFASHLQAWTETDETRRRELIAKNYTEDLEMIDPFFVVNGRENIEAFILSLQNKFPGRKFTLARPLESHNNIVRAFWALGIPGQPADSTGQDVIIIKDGKIHKLYVFLDGLNLIQQP